MNLLQKRGCICKQTKWRVSHLSQSFYLYLNRLNMNIQSNQNYLRQNIIIKMKKSFQQPNKNNIVKTKKQVRSMDDLFDLQQQNFDKLQMPEVNDRQYSKMLKQSSTKKVKSNNFFETNPKYRAANFDQLQDQQVQGEHGIEEQEDVNQQSDQEQRKDYKQDIRKSLLEMERQKKAKSRLMEDQIRLIEQEDQRIFEDIKKQDNDAEAGKSLKNQLNCFSKLVQLRYYSQGGLQQIKKYPITMENLPYSQQLHKNQKETERQILQNISLLMQASNSLIKRTNIMKSHQVKAEEQKEKQEGIEQSEKLVDQLETLLDQEDSKKLEQNRFDPQALFSQYLQNTKNLRSALEKELIKWSQKTALNNLSATNNQYSYLIMQTPVGQANKVVENFERAANKAQQKRGTFKILFEADQDVRKPNCKQIFDDFELFHQLQKQFEKQLNQQDDPQMLVNDTLKYLKQRQNRTKVQKDVDRRSSKNRKLRFDVHPKLLNFMTCKNPNLLEARDQIVNNIFNHGKNTHSQTEYIDM